MKKRISVEELSAYIDGESRHPEKIRQQIQQSEEVARLHVGLSKVSAHVRALPEPQVRPGFANRVLASLETSESRPAMNWRLPAATSFAAVAALVAFVVFVGLQSDDAVSPVETVASSSTASDVNAVSLDEEQALVAELERRLAASPDSMMLQGDAFYEEPAPVEALPEDMLLALAPEDWAGAFGRLHAQRIKVLQKFLREPSRQRLTTFTRLPARADNLIFHIRDIHHMIHLETPVFEMPAQKVLKHKRSQIANMRETVDRRAARIHPNLARHTRLKGLLTATESIE